MGCSPNAGFDDTATLPVRAEALRTAAAAGHLLADYRGNGSAQNAQVCECDILEYPL
jgi:hypothetical protein